MSNKSYGYVRVSTQEQNEDRQLIAMEQAAVPYENIFLDKQSGKDFNRPQYQNLIKKLRPGDTLFIKSIDRLGRNYEEIINQWQKIVKEIKADIVVLDMPILDTRHEKICWEHSSAILYFSFFHMSAKQNEPTSGSGRRRGLRRRKSEG